VKSAQILERLAGKSHDELRRALRSKSAMVRMYAAATILKKNGCGWFDVEFVRRAAESLNPLIVEMAEEVLVKAIENLGDATVVHDALADLFLQFLWDREMQVKALSALSHVAKDVDFSPRVMHRLEELLRDRDAARSAAATLENIAARSGNFTRWAILMSDSLRLTYGYTSPSLATIAEDALLDAADRKIDISPAVPFLEAAYATGNSGDNAGWALVRHYWNQGRHDDLRRLVPIRVDDSYLHVTVTISERAMHGVQGKPVERFFRERCGYCGSNRILCIFYEAGNDSWGRPWQYEYECAVCGKFTFYSKDPG